MTALTAVVSLWSMPAQPSTSVDADQVGAGTVGFLVIAGIAVMTYLLWRSMNKQLRKVDFEPPESGERPVTDQPVMDPRVTDLPEDDVPAPDEPHDRREDDPT